MSTNLDLARSDLDAALQHAEGEDEKRLEWALQMVNEGFLADAEDMLNPRGWSWPEGEVRENARNAWGEVRKHVHGRAS